MKIVLNQSKILELLKDFYEFTHVRVGLFDPNGKELLAYPQAISSYCSLIRKAPGGKAACMKSDETAYRHATTQNSFHVYTCHAGLTEMVVPIRGQGILLGYLMIGQFLLRKKAEPLQEEPFLSAYHALPVLDVAQIKAALHILQACAAYVWMDEYVRIQESSLGIRVKEYLLSHLDQKIQLPDLMREFDVGKTSLCRTIRDEFHMTFTELFQSLRITESIRLLQDPTLSIAEISHLVGFDDYNYFSRVFRQQTGVSPSVYRKQQ